MSKSNPKFKKRNIIYKSEPRLYLHLGFRNMCDLGNNQKYMSLVLYQRVKFLLPCFHWIFHYNMRTGRVESCKIHINYAFNSVMYRNIQFFSVVIRAEILSWLSSFCFFFFLFSPPSHSIFPTKSLPVLISFLGSSPRVEQKKKCSHPNSKDPGKETMIAFDISLGQFSPRNVWYLNLAVNIFNVSFIWRPQDLKEGGWSTSLSGCLKSSFSIPHLL